MSKEIIDLGYMNGWAKEPEIYKQCLQARKDGEEHNITGKTIHRCVTRTTCLTCGYTYCIDSGD